MILSRSYLTEQASRKNISEYNNKKQQIINENVNMAKRYDSARGRTVERI